MIHFIHSQIQWFIGKHSYINLNMAVHICLYTLALLFWYNIYSLVVYLLLSMRYLLETHTPMFLFIFSLAVDVVFWTWIWHFKRYNVFSCFIGVDETMCLSQLQPPLTFLYFGGRKYCWCFDFDFFAGNIPFVGGDEGPWREKSSLYKVEYPPAESSNTRTQKENKRIKKIARK